MVSALVLLYSLIRIRKALQARQSLKINEKNMALHLASFFLYLVAAFTDKVIVFTGRDLNDCKILKSYKSRFVQELFSFLSQTLLLYIFFKFSCPIDKLMGQDKAIYTDEN
jgi:hypothetical protein